MRTVDYLIVGQGLAGSCLGLELIKRNKTIMVIDQLNSNSSSRVAAGIYNPITGRTNQPTWRAKEIFDCLSVFYAEVESVLHAKLLNPIPIYRPYVSGQESGRWPAESNNWIELSTDQSLYNTVNDSFGGIIIRHSGYLNTEDFLKRAQKYFQVKEVFVNEKFHHENLNVSDLTYKNIRANKIIFCEGCGVSDNAWFNWLPITKLKGELLLVSGNLPKDAIINRGVFSVPLANGKFIVGSTYERDAPDGNSDTGVADIMNRANKLFRASLKMEEKTWGQRPTTRDRRPIMGSHPGHKNLCIFNGMGTKGVSLTPFFALQFADWLEGNCLLDNEVNIERFYSLSFKSK